MTGIVSLGVISEILRLTSCYAASPRWGCNREVVGEIRWRSLCVAGIAHLNSDACQSSFPSLMIRNPAYESESR